MQARQQNFSSGPIDMFVALVLRCAFRVLLL